MEIKRDAILQNMTRNHSNKNKPCIHWWSREEKSNEWAMSGEEEPWAMIGEEEPWAMIGEEESWAMIDDESWLKTDGQICIGTF